MQALSVALKGFVKPVLDSLALPESNPRELLKTVSFLLSKTTAATNELRAQFLDTPSTVMSSLTHPLFQPFERFISRYAELEGFVVNEEVRTPHHTNTYHCFCSLKSVCHLNFRTFNSFCACCFKPGDTPGILELITYYSSMLE